MVLDATLIHRRPYRVPVVFSRVFGYFAQSPVRTAHRPILLTSNESSGYPLLSTCTHGQSLMAVGQSEAEAADEASMVLSQLAYAQANAGKLATAVERLKQIVRSRYVWCIARCIIRWPSLPSVCVCFHLDYFTLH